MAVSARSVRIGLGLPDGEWKTYDENGAEVLKETFSSGNSRKIEAEATPEGGE